MRSFWWCLAVLVAPVFFVSLGCPDDMPTNGGEGEGEGEGETVSGEYDPGEGLMLENDSVAVTMPPGALMQPTQITVRPPMQGEFPAAPGGVDLAGAVFEPDGLAFDEPVQVDAALGSTTILPSLPVLTFDTEAGRWVGTGELATVNGTGTRAEFVLNHFSIAGIPDPVPIPDEGDPIGSFVVISNEGTLETDAIESETAALTFSEFGDMFNVAATSQEINMEGEIDTNAIGLDAILVVRIGNYVVGVVGGETSIYNAGQENQPVVGIMIMAVADGEVSLSLYCATPEQTIQGTLSGMAQ